MSLGIIYKMDDLLIKEIKECDMMIKSHMKDLDLNLNHHYENPAPF
jgi:hypothetical protein